jgi:plasmid maintenance system antidote protein VapI
LTERVSQADTLAEHYGVQVSPLTEVEVSNLANGINNMTVDEKMALANTLSQAPSLWGELDKKNQKAFAMAGAIGDPEVMRAVFQGQEMIREKLVQVPSKQDYLATFEDYVQDVYGTDDKAAIMQAAIAHYSAVQIPGEVFDGGLFEESLKAVAGTMEEVNGFRTVMPRGVDPDQFETFIDNIDADYIESIGGVANMTTEMAVDVIKNSRLYATGENFYEVRVNGMQSLMKKDGAPLVISYTPEAAGGVSARDQARRRKAQEENLATIRALRGR